MFRVRLDEETVEKLNVSAEKLNTSMSDVVRKGIDMVYGTLNK